MSETGIVLAKSFAFGDGSHPTTRLSLQAVRALAPRTRIEAGEPWRLLDFGSGTGILAIAAAKLGASAVGVEIDDVALAVAPENARLNAVEDRVTFVRTLSDAPGPFNLIVANILAGVLAQYAPDLVSRLAPNGTLILCGLVSTDVPLLIATYAPLLGARRPDIYERDEWRALVWPNSPVA